MRRSAFLVPFFIVVGACHDIHGLPGARRWGLITLESTNVSGQFYTRPEAIFYRSLSGPILSGRFTTDTCARFSYPPAADNAPLEHLNAGESITLHLSGESASLKPVELNGRTTYTVDSPGLRFTPGDSATFVVPGAPNGFPTMTIRGKSAEPVAIGPIETVLSAASDIKLTWSPAGDDGSRLVVSLQYTDDVAGLDRRILNSQVFCTLVDDGEHSLPGPLMTGWTRSIDGRRRVQVARWRTEFVPASGAFLFLVSTFQLTKEQFP